MKIKAAVVRKPGAPFRIEEVEIAKPKETEVLVRMIACGVCHTDAVARDQEMPVPLPAVLGHEGSGIVEEVGSRVRDIKPGDHVVLTVYSCGRCEACMTGHPSQCEWAFPTSFLGAYEDGTKRLSKDGVELSTFFAQASFATYAIADERNAIKIDKDVDLSLMGPLGCGIQTGAGTVMNKLKPEPGSAVVVFGCGAVGLSAIMAAKIMGADPIIGVDAVDSRLELAKELGAHIVFNGKKEKDLVTSIQEVTGGGADCSLDTTGVETLVNQALFCLKPLGTCAIVASSGDREFKIPLQNAIMGVGKTLMGVVEGDAIPKLFIPKLVKLYKQGAFPLDKLVQFYDFEEINQAFEDSKSGKTIKPILRF
ncbi:NAD(P)-dependent alcohol dehydrogenase [Alkalibacter rhizosphaerae]|uniref:NAD(P)-dependent alcohol dehydrogenase n=1 Tax=Alkalibacter rhizosphaerae TaxID=2815577 RepID=A0A974XER8_9FIRM|nr:NAD(P)-dependent alcohol dehydrogenase [Alkalibacter rhizosphaerae]QSX08411.1 NAD(P)-dependent alcohol dehydrogenase [Alkalibacter rhizosphaerae]